mgnify:FL=1|tara:strand:- start:3739 stop:4713 length:975 start_codon:yes stop_codon:yes gene_type:complete
MKLAILITGELRFKDRSHFESFKKKVRDHDVFISTYEKSKGLCEELSDKYIIHPADVDCGIDMSPRGCVRTVGAVLQWFHLDSLIKNYKDELLEYDYILKVRTDVDFFDADFAPHFNNLDDKTLYASTDLVFYSRTKHFIQTFGCFFDKIKNYYWGKCADYIPLNYHHILHSDDNLADTQTRGVRVFRLVMPEVLIAKRKNLGGLGPFRFIKPLIKDNYDFLCKFNHSYDPEASLLSINKSIVSNILGDFGLSSEVNTDALATKIAEALPYKHVDSITGFTDGMLFAPEQAFCIHAFNNGYVRNSSLKIDLMRGRQNFKFKLSD